MKEAIERLKALDERAKKYYWKDESEVVVKLSDVRLLIDFYESHKKESEATPNVQDITPEWDKIYHGFVYVAIDKNGDEYSYIYEPFHDERQWRTSGQWNKTGRVFDMTNIDWTKTLSKRPKKQRTVPK